MAFQNLYRGQLYSEQPTAEALAAGIVVSLGEDGWVKAADETKAQGVLMIGTVAAPAEDADGVNVLEGGVVETNSKIYVGSPATVDVGNCIVLTDLVAPSQEFELGDPVYCGNGILYKTAQNSGSAIGRVVGVEGADEIKVSFKFAT